VYVPCEHCEEGVFEARIRPRSGEFSVTARTGFLRAGSIYFPFKVKFEPKHTDVGDCWLVVSFAGRKDFVWEIGGSILTPLAACSSAA
jgi:hypothetical protein